MAEEVGGFVEEHVHQPGAKHRADEHRHQRPLGVDLGATGELAGKQGACQTTCGQRAVALREV